MANNERIFNWAALSAEEQQLVLDALEQHRKKKKRHAAMDAIETELKAAITKYLELGGFIAVDRDVDNYAYYVENHGNCYEINSSDIVCLYDWPPEDEN